VEQKQVHKENALKNSIHYISTPAGNIEKLYAQVNNSIIYKFLQPSLFALSGRKIPENFRNSPINIGLHRIGIAVLFYQTLGNTSPNQF